MISLVRLCGLAIAATFLVTAGGCKGPVGLMAGAELEGETRPVPTSWAFAGDSGTMQLETNPAEPYSVNLAYTILGDVLYINAGDTETQWVENMAADPRVRLRLDGVIYEMRSERVTDAAEIDRFGEAWTAQSMFRRDPRGLDEVWIYRVVAR